ncbi:MAG TPA: ADP-ribosylation factor-like protein [Chitinivibrionales bacterium]|nr:ADP-ribosylation factor-like protein [Chitinivibrionales bacterium]
MASINYAIREISVKIVFYGPGLSGKTTNLQVIHRKIPIDYRSDMVSLATETDRTLFFDFLPLDLGKIKGFSTKFQLYTVPGQVYYNATRKLVLRGVDGVVFVVDSAQDKMQENLESFQNLHDNLAEYGIKQGSIPIVVQYNKRDLPNAMPVAALDKSINKFGYPWNEAIANQGKGVFESLKIIGKIVIDNLNKKYSRPSFGQPQEAAPRPMQQQAAASTPRPAAADPFYAPPPQRPQPQQARPVAAPPPPPQRQQPQYAENAFPAPPQQAPRFQQPPVRAPAAPPPQPRPQPVQDEQFRNDYSDYGAINLEPMGQPAAPSFEPPPAKAVQQQSPPAVDKTELDLEIEKYQREIEEKQRRLRSLQSPQAPQQAQQPQQGAFPAPQQGSYDVYAAPATEEMQYPPQQQADVPEEQAVSEEDQPMYFTSVNPADRQRKKIKRPVNPKTKPQNTFLSKFFNKEKPE